MIYLDNGATSYPKPNSVYETVYSTLKYSGGNPGHGGHLMANKAMNIVVDARENLGKFFNIVNWQNICFTYNATYALNMAIKGLLKKGDHVVVSSFEHNSVIRPLYKLKEKGIEYSVIPSDATGNFENAENYIMNNTKMMIINHVSNVTGNIADIENLSRIAHKNNLIFMVDASQSAGHLNIDVQKDNIDVLVCSGHKGLLGPQGTGILYINEKLSTDTVMEGGTGTLSSQLFQPENLPERIEVGTLNTPGISGLSEGVKFINNTGIDKIRNHEKHLIKMLIDGLETINNTTVYGNKNVEKTSGVVSFNLNNFDSVTLTNILSEKYKIMLRGGLHCSPLAHKTIGTEKTGTARVGIGYFNNESDINILLNIIDKIK